MAQPTLASRLTRQLVYKLCLTVALSALAYVPYFSLQHFHVLPAMPVPATAFDRAIPFLPATTWIYLSLLLLIPIAPLLMGTRQALDHYAAVMAATITVSHIIFVFLPTTVAQPEAGPEAQLFIALQSIDGERNALPSLHASMATLSALFIEWVRPALPRRNIWRIALWIWSSAILVTTLTTKQHHLLDVIAGCLLAITVFGVFHLYGTRAVRREFDRLPERRIETD